MNLEIPTPQLVSLVKKQINNNFFLENSEEEIINECINIALQKSEYCFSKTENKYYKKNDVTYFNPFHSGQYSIFLYFLSQAIYIKKQAPNTLSDRVYYLNKIMNSLDVYYEINMPSIFMLDHPLGSVLGRAIYGEYFTFSQQCTVGNNKGIFPTIGKHVTMFSGSKIIGDCTIGDNVKIAANTYIKDTDIPSNSLVFGSSPNLIVKENAKHEL